MLQPLLVLLSLLVDMWVVQWIAIQNEKLESRVQIPLRFLMFMSMEILLEKVRLASPPPN